jgi:hypothetical protein
VCTECDTPRPPSDALPQLPAGGLVPLALAGLPATTAYATTSAVPGAFQIYREPLIDEFKVGQLVRQERGRE